MNWFIVEKDYPWLHKEFRFHWMNKIWDWIIIKLNPIK